jgi:ferredoxin
LKRRKKVKVEFSDSGKSAEWEDRFESILELARQIEVQIETDCEQGFCGTCKAKLISGEVDMETDEGLDEGDLNQNMVLPCVSVPKSDVVLKM